MEQLSFTDSNGITWAVREDGSESPRSVSGDVAPGASWLRFDSELEVRRLWHYPDDWRGLSPIQLESLLDRASTVIARFRSVRHAVAGTDALPRPVSRPAPELRAPAPRPEAPAIARPRKDTDGE